MKSIFLPSIPTPASVICLGTGGYGSALTEDESFALMDAFFERGGSFFDTAHVYADWVPGGSGVSERTLGKWIRSRGVRDRVVIGTKGAHPKLETMHIPRMKPEDIASDLAESLDRLHVDTVDLYWLHRDDEATPVSEIIDALTTHIDAGTIRAIGASNWRTNRLAEAAAYAQRTGKPGFIASQICWSLAKRSTPYDAASLTIAMDDTALAYYIANGPRVIPYSAQANGFFAHPYSEVSARLPQYELEINAVRHARASALADVLGCSPNCVALAYILNHRASGIGIAAPRALNQMADTCSAADIAISDRDMWFLEGLA